MPPKGSRVIREEPDSRSEGSSSNLKSQNPTSSGNGNGGTRGKRQTGNTNGGSSLLRDAVGAATGANSDVGLMNGGSGAFTWPTEPLDLLHAYRSAHNMTTPSAFSNTRNQFLLTNPGIGKQSPTMCRKKTKRKVGKEQLALAVRKNFNAAAVSEVEVMVGLLYKVRHQDKAFRIRAAPTKSTKSGTNGNGSGNGQ